MFVCLIYSCLSLLRLIKSCQMLSQRLIRVLIKVSSSLVCVFPNLHTEVSRSYARPYSAHLREVGPPPNTKHRQNSLNRLCSVCAGLCCKKNSLCCFVFLDIQIIFISHSEVTQPPPHTPNSPQIVSFVCASFVLVCAGKSFVCAASVF